MKFLLIHGSESAGYGTKTDAFRKHFGQDSVINPSYPPDRQGAIRMFEYLVGFMKDEPDFYLIGSSQGGLFSMYLAYKYHVKAILMNPLFEIDKNLFPINQVVENFKTGAKYILKEEWIDFMKTLVLTKEQLMQIKDLLFIYLDENDDLLNSHKTAEYFGPEFCVKMFPGGSHPFDHVEELIEDFRKKIGSID